ncbi:MAG: dUTPase [Candidatus Levybacteria bacterium RIFCSPLOWO2_01_FULL_36_13]|nr:MAG: dUTPase [Candidatus Levybacteria bacterium RIFCSPHIGHO2_01_FULL_36_15b]OGH35368.1 MAG: dUTPase [Candidatus Levybacteria bacterium RIFCSPLOWO2_01_FULL_36_13]
MNVKIKRIDKSLPLPIYHTKGSVGFDLVARENTVIKKNEIKLVPLNVIIKTPKGYGLFLLSRSSTPIKKGLIVANGVGLIDQDYCGEDDEIKIEFLNISGKSQKIEKGERLGQAVFVKLGIAKFKEVSRMSTKSRGGHGSTG